MKPKDRTILEIFYVNQAVWLPDTILRSKLKSQTVNLPLWMFNHIQKFDFITHLVSEMLQFEEFWILIGLEVFEP